MIILFRACSLVISDRWSFLARCTDKATVCVRMQIYSPNKDSAYWRWIDRTESCNMYQGYHDDVIKWKHFPHNWAFVRGIHRSPVNSPHKRQWRGALMFSLICVWINGWVNNREAGDLRPYRAHYDGIVMIFVTYIHIHFSMKYFLMQMSRCLLKRHVQWIIQRLWTANGFLWRSSKEKDLQL